VANSAQARKRARQNTNNRVRNASQRSSLRTSIKSFIKSLQNKDRPAAETAYREAVSSIDMAVHKGHHHKNRAARLKSRLNNRLRQMDAA
jgi:small subunit ribosomal protein S20